MAHHVCFSIFLVFIFLKKGFCDDEYRAGFSSESESCPNFDNTDVKLTLGLTPSDNDDVQEMTMEGTLGLGLTIDSEHLVSQLIHINTNRKRLQDAGYIAQLYGNDDALRQINQLSGFTAVLGRRITILMLSRRLRDLYLMSIDIVKETDTGSEVMWKVSMPVCDAIKDEDAPWKPAFEAMGIEKCPIDAKDYDVKDMKIDMSFAESFLNQNYVGFYSVQVKVENQKKDTICCYVLGVSIVET